MISKGNDSKLFYKISFLTRLIFWIMVAPSIVLVTVKTHNLYKYFTNITSLNCSNEENNRNFNLIAEDIYNKVHYRNLVMIWLSFVGILLEIIMCGVALNTPKD